MRYLSLQAHHAVILTVGAVATLLVFYGIGRQYGGRALWGRNTLFTLGGEGGGGVDGGSGGGEEQEGGGGLYTAGMAGGHLNSPWVSARWRDVFNETLGFQTVRMISMPERTDKQDAFALAASLSGFTYELVDGVDGAAMSAKAIPYVMAGKNPKVLGCWRAHANVWSEVVRKGLKSTLVFEDDADWSVGFRAQLLEVAKGARYVSGEREGRGGVYGEGWDFLWLGHCGAGPAPWNPRRWVIPDDPTVQPPELRDYIASPDMRRWEEGAGGSKSTRIVFPAMGGVCTVSYVISLQGARKALLRLSLQAVNEPVDWGLSRLCADRDLDFRCISVFPALIGSHRPAGNTSGWSDIDGDSKNVSIEVNAHTERLAFSTKMNLERLLKGERSFESAFPDVDQPQMEIEEITSAVGVEREVPLREDLARLSNEELKGYNWDWVVNQLE